MDFGTGGGEADGPGVESPADQVAHGRQLVGAGHLGRVAAPVSHHVGAHRGVGDVGTHVEHAAMRAEYVQIVRERLPTPGQALGQGRSRDVLHPFEQADEPVMAIGPGRGETDAAVAHGHGGDPVPRRGGQQGIPGGLAVEVSMDVDESGRHQGSVGIDLPPGRLGQPTDAHHPVALHTHIGGHGRGAGAVHHRPTFDDQIEHGLEPMPRDTSTYDSSAPPPSVMWQSSHGAAIHDAASHAAVSHISVMSRRPGKRHTRRSVAVTTFGRLRGLVGGP